MKKSLLKIGMFLLFSGIVCFFTTPWVQGIKNPVLLNFLNILLVLSSFLVILCGISIIIYNAAINLKQPQKSHLNHDDGTTKHTYMPHKELNDKEKKYIFLFGSENGAAHKVGNIKVIDNVPYIIKENDELEKTSWDTVIQLAKNDSFSTYAWIKNINADNWKDYAFTFHPKNQPTDNNSIMVYIFRDDNHEYGEAVMNHLVIDKSTKKPCIKHFVANWHGGHDPWLVSVTNESTFEDIRLLASDLHIDSLLDIDENNWIDKIEVFLSNNEYQIETQSNIFSFIDILKKSSVDINKIECKSLFEQDNHLNCTYYLPIFLKEFKYDWRMFEFQMHCTEQNKDFVIKVNGWDRVAIAEYPRNINEILYPGQRQK